MNKLKELWLINQSINKYNALTKEIQMNSKSIFASKSFWFNVAGILLTIGQIMPPKMAFYVLGVGNIITRLLTDQPVHIVTPKDDKIQFPPQDAT